MTSCFLHFVDHLKQSTGDGHDWEMYYRPGGHQAQRGLCWVHLEPLKVEVLQLDGLTHLDGVTPAVFTAHCGKVQQV